MNRLRITSQLALPADAVTQAIGIVAKRRAGKSYAARKFAEQLHHAGQQIVVVDPKGDWWGIRSAADGKGPGLPIVILGGERGDVPLEAGSGEVVARLVTEERVSALLDLSLFRKHEVSTFMTAFLENLYRLKAREIYRTPLMLFMDEADAIAPQKPQPNEARMLGAVEDIVRRGGQRGIGCTMITQRCAVLNKNVLTQVQMLVALRTIAPQDLKAMGAWVEVHGTDEEKVQMMNSLPSLPTGDAWFWSPGWPTTDGIFEVGHVLPIETFDSGATPKSGEKRAEPKTVAEVDMDALRRNMAETIERAKADDPKHLRARIAQLEKELKAKAVPQSSVVTDNAAAPKLAALSAQNKKLRNLLEEAMKFIVTVKAVNFGDGDKLDQKALNAAVSEAVRQFTEPLTQRIETRMAEARDLSAKIRRLEKDIAAALEIEIPIEVTVQKSEPFTVSQSRAPRVQKPIATNGNGRSLQKSHARIVNAMGALHSIGESEPMRRTVAGWAGLTDGGSFGARLSELRTMGLVEDAGPSQLRLTADGLASAGEPTIQSLDDLHQMWLAKVGTMGQKILRVLIDRGGEPIARAELAEAVGAVDGGSFGARLSELRSPGLITDAGRGVIGASDLLFPAGLQ